MGVAVEGLVALSTTKASTAALQSLMLAEQRRIFLLCQRLLQDREEADAATQDVFLKAWLALEKDARIITDAGKWLVRIAVNTCLDRLRSRRWQIWRRRPAPDDEETILLMAPVRGPTAEDKVFALEIGRRLRDAMKKLSGRQLAVFTLRHYEERTLEDIAGLLEMEVGTVKAHLARALLKMREELRDLYHERQC